MYNFVYATVHLTELLANSQKITYKSSEIYLIEFANICYQLLKIATYIWDIGFEFMNLKVQNNNISPTK